MCSQIFICAIHLSNLPLQHSTYLLVFFSQTSYHINLPYILSQIFYIILIKTPHILKNSVYQHMHYIHYSLNPSNITIKPQFLTAAYHHMCSTLLISYKLYIHSCFLNCKSIYQINQRLHLCLLFCADSCCFLRSSRIIIYYTCHIFYPFINLLHTYNLIL